MKKNSEAEQHIVIAGMGFGGLAAALALSKVREPGTTVTLVDRHRYHQFNATLYEVATAWMAEMPEGALGVLKRSNCIPVEQLLLRMPSVRFLHTTISQIDPRGRELEFTDGTALHFDALILALGSETDDLGIPGVATYAIGLKTVADAVRVRNDMEAAVADAAQDKRAERIVRILVGGGGFSGTEFSGELAAYARVLARAYRFDPKRIHIEVLEATPHLLSGLNPWAGRMAEARLNQLGVRLRLNTRVVQVQKNAVTLSNGDRVPCDLLVWTGGVRANRLVRASGLKCDARGRLLVGQTLQTSAPNIFAVGDTVALTPPGHKQPLPWVASLAVEQGKLAATNARRLLARQRLLPFTGQLLGFVIPIGGKFALAVLSSGVRFSGFSAWVLRQCINLKYFLSILGPLEALRLWFAELSYYTKND
jgi:NADH dehydrogenase